MITQITLKMLPNMRKLIVGLITASFVLTIGQLSILNKVSIGIAVVIFFCFLIISSLVMIIGFKKRDYALMLLIPIAVLTILFFKLFTDYQYKDNLAKCEKVFKKLANYKAKHGVLPRELQEAFESEEQVPKIMLGISRISLEYSAVADYKYYRITFPAGYGIKQTWDSSIYSWDYQD